MATYIMSDIHGDILSFREMLELIEFDEHSDFLIVNGDVLDRGEQGIEILILVKDMVEKGRALMLKGNHELFAQMYMEGTLTDRKWVLFSGESSLRDLQRLEEQKREELLCFIKELPIFLEQDIPKYGETVITHSGLKDEYLVYGTDERIDVVASIEKAYQNDEYSLLISADMHYWGKHQQGKLDKYIICGHVPTYQLGPEYTGKVLETHAYLDLDAGAGYHEQGGRLACYRCEDGKCFYI